LKDFGDAYPNVEQVVSVYADGQLQPQEKEKLRFAEDHLVVTFDGLSTRSPFALQVRNLLQVLEEKLGVPVEIEFASNGEHLYLLQCRAQMFAHAPRPAPIPKDVAKEKIIFSANRHVSNGWAANITHVVYLDPAAYEALEKPSHYEAVERVVRKLNELLPKRQFILMAPTHWAARGEGPDRVGVKYDDVKNAAVLVELAKPDPDSEAPLSFGMHFLQDLVESDIRYLPVLPDDEGIHFNKRFLMQSPNILPEMLPEFAFLSDALRVIDVKNTTDGKVIQVLMNADLDEALGILTEPEEEIGHPEEGGPVEDGHPENYWRWRYRMAEQVAARLDPGRFGVAGFYVFGSAKNGTAGPASDIDVLVHFRGTEAQREDLEVWLEGWSLCLDEINYLQTGYRSGGLLDIHLVTDEDISARTSYAVKINAVTDAAHPLEMKDAEDSEAQVLDTGRRSVGEGAT
jgi:hypothetical protein